MLRCAITDRKQFAESEPLRHCAILAQAARLAAEGVDYIQLREKDLPVQHLIGTAREILSLIRQAGSRTKLLVNSRADVAVAAGAAGVHLPSGEDQLTPAQVRQLFRDRTHSARSSDPGLAKEQAAPHFKRDSITVSVSCHIIPEVERARKDGADLILFGPIFGKSVAGKLVAPELGLEALRSACEAAGETPVLALGGVTAANTAACLAVGAKGIAAIRLFC